MVRSQDEPLYGVGDSAVSEPGASDRRHFGRSRRWAVQHWVSIVLVAIATLYGGAVTILHDDTASPIDEVVYLDYAYKVWDQGMVYEGEQFGDDVAQLVACENVIPFGSLGQVCGSGKVNLESMPNEGYTTGAAYTPLYFWTVRAFGEPIHVLTGLSEVTSWRLSGVVWLSGTVILLAALLRRAGISNLAILTLGALFIGAPYSWWTYTYLSTDVSVVFFGSAALFVAIEANRGRLSPWWLLPVAVIAPLFKITNLLVFGLVILYLVIDRVAGRLRTRRAGGAGAASVAALVRFWLPIIVSVGVAAVVQVVWMRVVPLLAVSDVVVDQGISTPLTGSHITGLMLSGIGAPITHNPFVRFAGTPLIEQIYTPLSWVMIAGVVGAIMVFRWDSERGPIIWGTAIASVTALPALGIVMWLLTHSYFPLPARYAAALIPAILLVAGFVLKNRAAMAIGLAYAGVLLVFGIGLAVHVGLAY